MILRNSEQICRKHYVQLDAQQKKSEAMSKLETAWETCCAENVQQESLLSH
jgi:hypothetical protein